MKRCKFLIFTVFILFQCFVLGRGEEDVTQVIRERLQWYGQSSFSIFGSQTVYMDPFELPEKENLQAADIIFITHPHYDHLSVKDIEKIRKTGTIMVAPYDCASKLPKEWDIRWVKPGDQLEIYGIKAEVVPAYNRYTPYHPKKNGWVGYIIHMDGETYYHAGDTDFIPEMRGIKTDIAMLPMGGTYTMKWEDAVEAVKAFQPKVAIPMHYGKAEGTVEDAKSFRDASKIPVAILEKQNK